MANQNKKENMALKIKSLESEYETVLRQYEEAYQTYLTYIDDGANSSSSEEYTQLKGRAFWGTAGVKEDAADSAEACRTCVQRPKHAPGQPLTLTNGIAGCGRGNLRL